MSISVRVCLIKAFGTRSQQRTGRRAPGVACDCMPSCVAHRDSPLEPDKPMVLTTVRSVRTRLSFGRRRSTGRRVLVRRPSALVVPTQPLQQLTCGYDPTRSPPLCAAYSSSSSSSPSSSALLPFLSFGTTSNAPTATFHCVRSSLSASRAFPSAASSDWRCVSGVLVVSA